ncbi:cell division protein FtsL [Streptomyces sp. C10-9-1]|uniref:FtsB family cell division protein n=1 Tax=Streptomyces sp. C10-9-1 TaxID=1859285 RepID=UPI0021131949|nr:cell division protein FtsL [Streptomyces sp. C10-9-1]MCQ6556047.1 cell division protein FtsL [Streptomyces sp. C10-9-1]
MSTTARQLRGKAARLARLLPSGPSSAARTPFVLLVVLLLSGGLITLLLLNSSLSQGSFRLSELKKRTTELTDQQQALQRDVDGRSAPDALARRARELGMVPGGSPAFLDTDGTVRGVPGEATAPPPPPPTATPSSSAAADDAAAEPSAPASATPASDAGPGASPEPPAPSAEPSPTPSPTSSGR